MERVRLLLTIPQRLWAPGSFFLIIAACLGYAALGVGLIAAALLLSPTIVVVFVLYLVLGSFVVRHARKEKIQIVPLLLGIPQRLWEPKSFLLIIAICLGYAALGVGSLLAFAAADPLISGEIVAVFFVSYLVLGPFVVVWLSLKILRRYGTKASKATLPKRWF